MWTSVPATQTHCHHAHRDTLSPLCRLSGIGGEKKKKKALSYLPKGIALLMPGGLVFPFYSLPHAVSEHPAFFHQLLILIQRKNHQAYTIESFFFSSFPSRRSLRHPTHSCLSPFCTLLHQLRLSTKGAPMLSQIGVEMGLSEIDKFHPRGDH